jgi:hypothetical protein
LTSLARGAQDGMGCRLMPPISVSAGGIAFRRQQRRWSNGFVQVAQNTVCRSAPARSLTRRVAAISRCPSDLNPRHRTYRLFLGVILHGSLAPFAGMLEIIGLMTVLVALGITLPPYLALKRLLNHKALDVTGKHYTVIGVERLRDPMQRITDFILRAAGERESATVTPIAAQVSA